ncbi:MAG TPA: enoyl-CoA hydratase-related protein [Pseudonocardiaceae bacterium]|nr:enoyl-CoA hydratase-related protein [Pseudonocardiaceae bacterium]
MSLAFDHVLVTSVADGVAHVELDRPPVNAVSQDMYVELREMFSRCHELLPAARVLVLSGRGRHFCAGNDLGEFGEMTERNASSRMRSVREAFAAIYECPVPTIAAVHGSALGTGTAIAACCDLIMCAESAMLGTPEVGVGVMGGGRHLARIVPEHVMRLMYFTGDPVPARDLVGYGGIAAVVPDDRLLAEAFELASRIARHSGVVLRHAKDSLNRAEFMELRAGYEAEQQVTIRLAGHPDSIEARGAMVQRRPPQYEGKE